MSIAFSLLCAARCCERHRRPVRDRNSIAAGGSLPTTPEILVASGNPAEEIARWANVHRVGLLVTALHGSADGGPSLGSVTYRAIAKSGVVTLAPPPARPVTSA